MSFFLIVGTSLKEILLKTMCILHIKNRNICLQEVTQLVMITPNKVMVTSSNLSFLSCADMSKRGGGGGRAHI
jgi:hypothetical protein